MPTKPFLYSLLSLLILLACKQKPADEPTVEAQEKMPEITVELALKTNAQLGEGAYWDHKTQRLYWVDILGKTVYQFDPETKVNLGFDMPSRVGTVVPQTDSTIVVALEDGIYVKNMVSDALIRISDVEADRPENRFNDGKCDPNGNLWVGSMNLAETDPTGSLYKVAPDGTTTAMLPHVTISNGIVWSKDETTMYYIDTPTAVIRAFDFDKETATISNERIAVRVSDTLGYPDGMAIDNQDHLWVGMWNGNAVLCFDPQTGQVIDRIEVPAHNVTSCAFGGPDLDELFITTASVDMTADERSAYPLAGSVFRVKPGVSGVPSAQFGRPN